LQKIKKEAVRAKRSDVTHPTIQMDAGTVLNNLLARHHSHVSTANTTAVIRRAARQEKDAAASTPATRPPPKVLEAVDRGVNPLMLNVNLHHREAAAREQAKRRRTEAGVAAVTPSLPRDHRKGRKDAPQRSAAKNEASKGKKHVEPFWSSPRKTAQAGEAAASRTLEARHRELRAQQQREAEERKRGRSASSIDKVHPTSSSATKAEADSMRRRGGEHPRARVETNLSLSAASPGLNKGATVQSASSRRAPWRRRCTTSKILRLSRGVTRAAALRRYWYTTLSDIVGVAAPVKEDQTKVAETPSSSGRVSFAQRTQDAVEARCALRRRRAARRAVLADFHARASTGTSAAAAAPATTFSERDRSGGKGSARLTRRQYKGGIRDALQQAEACMWGLAVRVVAERRAVIHQLTSSIAASAQEKRPTKDGVLPLLLARHFPLFGALVEVQELELRVPRINRRRTRHRRRARFAGSNAGQICVNNKKKETGAFLCAAQLCVLQRHRGVVVEDYSDTIGVLLLPASEEGQASRAAAIVQCSAVEGDAEDGVCCETAPPQRKALSFSSATQPPRVVRVPKHFPGASGAFAELLPMMLAATHHRNSVKPGSASSTGAASSPTPTAKTRVLAAVFIGEVEDSGVVGTEATNESSVAATLNYPLKRLQNRCL
jgi:hypothetical protein